MKLFLFLLFIALFSGCASHRTYFIDRGRDAADVFNATVGMGIGAKAQVGPFHAGLIANADYRGLRGGRWIKYSDSGEVGIPHSAELEAILYGISYDQNVPDKRNKGFGARIFHFMPLLRIPETSRHPRRPVYSNLTQIEVVLGFLGSLRLGFNPGELLDFILGWGTIDIFNDDIERKNVTSLQSEHVL